MSKKLFIGSLSWNTTDEGLKSTFAQYGDIEDSIIISDNTGRSKGFGFVTFVNDADADKAIAELNGFKLDGRAIIVNEARPKTDRPARRF